MSGVAFFAYRRNHESVLRPSFDAIEGRLPAILTSDEQEVARMRPSIIVLPGHRRLEWFRQVLPDALIGSVRHGLVTKRVIERRTAGGREVRFDFVCVGDPMAADRYRRLGAEPTETWMTGYPQLDPLFRRDPPPDLGFDGSRPIVLFAPTWNAQLSSAPVLGERIAELVRGKGDEIDLLIKPHPVMPDTSPEWMASWERLAATDPHVRLVDAKADVIPCMLAADLLISDVSSTIFEFMALDRPIVLVTNPGARQDAAYNANDISWRWRDVGAEVTDIDDLAAVIAAELADPGRRAAERRRYSDELFGDLQDGQNARRVADGLVDLAARMDAGTAPAPLRSVSTRPPRRRMHAGSLPARARRRLRRVLG